MPHPVPYLKFRRRLSRPYLLPPHQQSLLHKAIFHKSPLPFLQLH